MPFSRSDSITVCTGCIALSTGSVITSVWLAPRSFRSMPTSRVTPAPKRTLDTAISNAMSFAILVVIVVSETAAGPDTNDTLIRSVPGSDTVKSGAGGEGRRSRGEHLVNDVNEVVEPQRLETDFGS